MFYIPAELEPGTFPVHTHPAHRNEFFPACGGLTYRNNASQADMDVIAGVAAVHFGLILDFNGFILHNGSVSRHVSNQCGFRRNGH